jgi:hypothetical protein
LACANKLQDSIDEVVEDALRFLIEQNSPGSSSAFHVSKDL